MKKVNLSWAGVVLVFGLLLWCTAATPGTITDPANYTCAVYSTALSLLPPVVAIVLALNTKEVYTSLLVGIATGALLYANGNLELALNTLFFNEEGGMVAKLADSSNVGILVFLVMLGILVALMNKAGGSAAFGRWASTHIHTRAGAQLATFVLGVVIFVDDYFNCLTVGSVMRPVTDRQKVSRAKLAYLIDATAAPVCIIAPVSSWAAAVTSSVPEGSGINGFTMFLRTIPYNYYALLTLVMIFFLVLTGADYGPMKLNEDNALNGDLFTTDDRPLRRRCGRRYRHPRPCHRPDPAGGGADRSLYLRPDLHRRLLLRRGLHHRLLGLQRLGGPRDGQQHWPCCSPSSSTACAR